MSVGVSSVVWTIIRSLVVSVLVRVRVGSGFPWPEYLNSRLSPLLNVACAGSKVNMTCGASEELSK